MEREVNVALAGLLAPALVKTAIEEDFMFAGFEQVQIRSPSSRPEGDRCALDPAEGWGLFVHLLQSAW
jgi:hypothetical protein